MVVWKPVCALSLSVLFSDYSKTMLSNVCVCRVQPCGGGGPRGGEWRGVPQALRGETCVCRGPQRVHLLPNVCWRRQPEAFQKGTGAAGGKSSSHGQITLTPSTNSTVVEVAREHFALTHHEIPPV